MDKTSLTTSTPVSAPFIPDHAPFTPAQRAWLNGFLAAIFSAPRAGAAAPAPPPAATKVKVCVLFGSESGNCEALAKRLAKVAQGKGYDAAAKGLDKIKLHDLAKEKYALFVASTFGDGEPPENAKEFHAALLGGGAPRLENLSFSICALGDTNYEKFCQCGKDFDAGLHALGAKRIFERADCNVDFEETFQQWQEGVFSVLDAMAKSEGVAPASANGASPKLEPEQAPEAAATLAYSRKNPFLETLLTNRKLTSGDSAKETRHYEISLEGSGLTYEAGDALGVFPTNCPALVEDVLRALNCDGEEAVPAPDGSEAPLRIALTRHYEINKAPPPLLQTIAERSADKTLRDMLDPSAKDALKHYLWGREVVDLLVDFASAKLSAVEFVGLLKSLQPRLYSISSSLKAFPNQVHLTVAAVRYESFGRKRKGVCSTFLADRANGAVPVFIQTSHSFRTPRDGGTPMIMVGPGTGVAPFRAFLHDRRATGAKGVNWLFFGEQRAATDFFYRDEFDAMLADGHLTKLSTAFSRDQAEKVYVQHRMLEHAADLWKWLQDGAHFYVCGDATRMAKDVDAALHSVIETAGGLSRDDAEAYVQKLKTDKRYQ